jgi:hypothetical protein
MSTPEVERIMGKLEGVGDSIEALREQYKTFDFELKEQNRRLYSVEGKLDKLTTDHCRIQEEKSRRRTPWYSIIPSVVSGITLAFLLYLLAMK